MTTNRRLVLAILDCEAIRHFHRRVRGQRGRHLQRCRLSHFLAVTVETRIGRKRLGLLRKGRWQNRGNLIRNRVFASDLLASIVEAVSTMAANLPDRCKDLQSST